MTMATSCKISEHIGVANLLDVNKSSSVPGERVIEAYTMWITWINHIADVVLEWDMKQYTKNMLLHR